MSKGQQLVAVAAAEGTIIGVLVVLFVLKMIPLEALIISVVAMGGLVAAFVVMGLKPKPEDRAD